jgi:hypothetical protein
MGEAKIGFLHLHTGADEFAGKRAVRTTKTMQSNVLRGAQSMQSSFEEQFIRSPDGRPLGYQSTSRSGGSHVETVAVIEGNRLSTAVTAAGRTTKNEYDWSDDYELEDAVERSLQAKPMQPGEKRSLRIFLVGAGYLVETNLAAADWEPTWLAPERQSRRLLRVECRQVYPNGEAIEQTCWVDEQGVQWKCGDKASSIFLYRTTEETARATDDGTKLDFVLDLTIPLARPLEASARATEARYRITLESAADPTELFVDCPSQRIRPVDERTIEATVRKLSPKAPLDRATEGDLPTDDDRRPGAVIESDDPRVVAMAGTVAAKETDPWKTAQALEKLVHDSMRETNFGQALATAAETARDLSGDCSEYAVLLAALCRAREIPARIAVGLVYVENRQALGYHMWTEVWIEDRWIALDATLSQGAGADRLKVAHTSLAAGIGDPKLLKITRLLGAKPKIELLE